MILFERNEYHSTKDGGIYLSYQQIEMLTEKILEDYNPQILRVPQAVEYDDFIECYLGVVLDYQHIYSTGSQGDILGCTIFSKQKLAIFDKENMCKSYLTYCPIAVILDRSLIEGNRKVQENITGLHEAGHIWLHGSFFTEDINQMRLKDVPAQRTCCRKKDMEDIEKVRCSNAEMWREWQATTFAVTLALPRKSLEIAVPEVFCKYSISGKQLIIDDPNIPFDLYYHTIPAELSKIYNMSKEAIRYRLQKTGFYTTRDRYEAEHAQLSLFDFL